MKKLILVTVLLITIKTFAGFNNYFQLKTLRIDYIHAGNSEQEFYYLDNVKTEPYWGGSLVNLIDTFNYGEYFFKVFDTEKDSLIYSRGYSTLFGEWQTTLEAKKTSRGFVESVVMPLPRRKAKIILYSRDKKGHFQERFSYDFDPANYFVSPEKTNEYPYFDAHISGGTDTCVDIVILPEGYTQEEMGLFISDCIDFTDKLFSFEPYSSHKEHFNIRGVLAPSKGSGSDIPADSIWTQTLLGTSFYTFDSERYCMTSDYKSVRDLAANAPYDQIYILVNAEKYGGGAIYNYYSVSVNSNIHAAKIFIHEFGHGFAGLGDEYYNSEVAYSDFYPMDVQPWEPNLTTLVDFDSKWSTLLDGSVPVPTPPDSIYLNQTGVFEGGGYASKGVYRPAHDCLMNTFRKDKFCEVCTISIEKMIRFYTQ
ncbi:MAG: IgA Peptidase M64 [Bacteroidales bacterium]|nr:IgA Peptidase M64 [Bacteroidales bacterium]MCF8403940.1 IgA Peptidase M64 [Bacteroidales bacterium]